MKTKTLLLTVALLISGTSAVNKETGDDLLHKSTTSQLSEDGKFIKDEKANVVYNKNEKDDGDVNSRWKKAKEAEGKMAATNGDQVMLRGSL